MAIFGSSSKITALEQELHAAHERERWYLEHLASFEPKSKTLFPEEDPVIPDLQLRYLALIEPQHSGIPAELPKQLVEMQHRLAHHINEHLGKYDPKGTEARPLTRLKGFFEKLRIADADADTREGKVFAGLQECVARVSEGLLLKAAASEYGPLCGNPNEAFKFLTMIESTGIFRIAGLKDKLLANSTITFTKPPA